jgi:hypothetical protein
MTQTSTITEDQALALQAIRTKPGHSGWTAIATLREDLWHLPRAEQDALMKKLLRAGLVDIIPVGNLKALQQRDRDAALTLGGQQTHAIKAR